MSSKGTPRTTVRIATALLDQVQRQLDSLHAHSPRDDWTVGEFIRVAILEKLAKMQRSRNKKRHLIPERFVQVANDVLLIPSVPELSEEILKFREDEPGASAGCNTTNNRAGR